MYIVNDTIHAPACHFELMPSGKSFKTHRLRTNRDIRSCIHTTVKRIFSRTDFQRHITVDCFNITRSSFSVLYDRLTMQFTT